MGEDVRAEQTHKQPNRIRSERTLRRVYYQMAQDGVLFAWAGEVHPTFQTPARAIVLQAVWSSVLVWTGTYRARFTRVIYTEWIFFALLGIGILMLRRRPGYHPAWPMPLVPLAPLLFVAASAAIVVNQVAADSSKHATSSTVPPADGTTRR